MVMTVAQGGIIYQLQGSRLQRLAKACHGPRRVVLSQLLNEIPLTTVTTIPITTRLERVILQDYHDFPILKIFMRKKVSVMLACLF